MSILARLASQSGDWTAESNKRVVALVLQEPALLAEIAPGLESADAKLVGDCAEVMTMVAATRPELVVPYAAALIARLDDRDKRVRWETVHSLAEIAARAPDVITPLVRKLDEKIALDRSVIVRDYAILTLGEYGATSQAAARRVWPHLRQALLLWEGKHVGKALAAMLKLVKADPALKIEAEKVARLFADHKQASVRTAAKRLLK